MHLVKGVEVAHDMRRTEGVTRLHGPAMDFLDHHDNPPGTLAAPCLVDDRRFERQAGEPGAVLTGLLVAQVIRPNEVRWRPVRVTAVAELPVGGERGEEL